MLENDFYDLAEEYRVMAATVRSAEGRQGWLVLAQWAQTAGDNSRLTRAEVRRTEYMVSRSSDLEREPR